MSAHPEGLAGSTWSHGGAHPRAVDARCEAVKATNLEPWDSPCSHTGSSGAVKAHAAVLANKLRAVEIRSRALEAHPEASKAHPGALDAHPGVVETHPRL